jgi:hypothetical protein
MNDTGNIVMFPRGKRGQRPQTLELIRTNVLSLRTYHVDKATRVLATMLFSNMKRAGIDIGAEMDKDIASVIESIRSLLSAYYGIYHPFQRLTAELFRNGDTELAHIPPGS